MIGKLSVVFNSGVPSNFCPGSLMFLFERLDTERCLEKRILYTGDFRLDDARTCLRSLASLRPLHGPDPAAPLRIHELYLDTTFCSPAFPSFPTRRNAEEKIWEVLALHLCSRLDRY